MGNEFLTQTSIQQQRQNFPPEPIFMKEEIQDIVGLLVGEYYPDKEKFTKDHSLVKELQQDLIKLGYNLGTAGADGKLGAKTKIAMHNFEQDFVEFLQIGADAQEGIQNLISSSKGKLR